MNIQTRLQLNNKTNIPILGFGTWQLSGKKAKQAVLAALKAGYRHIDTAAIYGNEKEVGEAIQESGISRSEIFVTTKLWNSNHDNVEKAFEHSLSLLNLEYVDLYLMHYPVAKVRNISWDRMEELYKSGKCRAIGVSNFTIKHLQELLKLTKTIPVVNQVEFTPFLYQKELLDFCKKNEIRLEAYSPLTRGEKLGEPKLVALAKKYRKSPAQMLIRWCIQHDVIVLPKASSEPHIKENADVFNFDISETDMAQMDSWNENARYCWDPTQEP